MNSPTKWSNLRWRPSVATVCDIAFGMPGAMCATWNWPRILCCRKQIWPPPFRKGGGQICLRQHKILGQFHVAHIAPGMPNAMSQTVATEGLHRRFDHFVGEFILLDHSPANGVGHPSGRSALYAPGD